ncbi:TetR family transcriptional regulator [Streptomyces sp. NBC_01445]|uniref:TetR family transcriptional regulator n=1 Tax=Streptomyces sp. NBC_01445 TaxID=2903869 RepID=UPI002DD86CB1|nr:TetR family transcriptional regulator [Streptomyces sp. NBC_01445]WSE02219.1 TetR family transcriptional regulator [Streptomyces sp. NBC_01445]
MSETIRIALVMALVFSSGSVAGGPRSASKILDAARDVLSGQGYAALTIEAVAAAAGVGKSTISRAMVTSTFEGWTPAARPYRHTVIPPAIHRPDAARPRTRSCDP